MRRWPLVLQTVMLASMPAPALAADISLPGMYEGGDTAAESVYGTLTIGAKTLTWRDLHTHCTVGYRRIADSAGTRFKDQTDHEFVTGPDAGFTTYLLKLDAATCRGQVRYFRLTFPFARHPAYLALIEMGARGEPLGYMHFFRRRPK